MKPVEAPVRIRSRKSQRRLSPATVPKLNAANWRCTDYVTHTSFSSKQAESLLFGAGDQPAVPAWTSYWQTADIDTPQQPKALKADEERRLFLRYNYARFMLSKLTNLRSADPASLERHIALWRRRASQARSQLAQANMALVLAMAKRFQLPHVEFEDLVGEGNMALLRCIDKFNVSYGFKFSTYACRAILKSFHRLSTKMAMYRRHFPANFDPELEQPQPDAGKHDVEWQETAAWIRHTLNSGSVPLTDTERTIVVERFGLFSSNRGKTLAEVGDIVNLSTEGVRRILSQVLLKLRHALEGTHGNTNLVHRISPTEYNQTNQACA